MDSLRVDSGIKKIEVNDNGDYISVPMSDTSFFERFGEVVRGFEKKEAEYTGKAGELAEKHKEKSDGDIDAMTDVINLYAEFCRDMCVDIERLFGFGCCKKIFPDIEVPSIELIGDFFEQITPLLNKYAKERNERINLVYNRNRKGARSK